MADATCIKVMIVDESELLRIGLRSSLDGEGDIETVGEFATGAEAIAQVKRLKPKVVLLSVSLPDIGGFQACRQIIDLVPGTRVVMLISELADELIAASMMAGAAGCLPNSSPQIEVIRIVRFNGNGAMYHTPEVAEIALRTTRHNSNFINMIRLSSRERRIIVMVADGLNYSQIGEKLGISPHTIRNQTGRMVAKLNVSKRAELSVYAPLIRLLDIDALSGE